MSYRGDSSEKYFSSILHESNTAVLISPQLMRCYNCQQIDLAIVKNYNLELYEVKSSQVGILSAIKRNERMQNAQLFLSDVLGISVRVNFIAKEF